MSTKRTSKAKDQPVFTVRIPVDITQDATGNVVVKSYRLVSHPSDRGNDVQMSADEYAAFSDVLLDWTIRWTPANAETSRSIKRDADLYIWWRALIEGPLSHVPIGSDEFRQSRAGLINHTLMNSIRRTANLSAADFKALSLAEVVDVISDIHAGEHNAENNRKQAAKQTIQMSETDGDSTKTDPRDSDDVIFRMNIHEQSKTVTRKDSLGIERTTAIKNPEQWSLFLKAVNASGTLSKAQVHDAFPNKADRDRNIAALRLKLQEIQLTFNADGKDFVIKEFSGA